MAEVDALARVQISPRGSVPVALGRYAANAILASEWLAVHDREVAAKALRDAADEAQQGFVDEQQGIGFARVRTDWLRARADRIELQASEKGASDVR